MIISPSSTKFAFPSRFSRRLSPQKINFRNLRRAISSGGPEDLNNYLVDPGWRTPGAIQPDQPSPATDLDCSWWNLKIFNIRWSTFEEVEQCLNLVARLVCFYCGAQIFFENSRIFQGEFDNYNNFYVKLFSSKM